MNSFSQLPGSSDRFAAAFRRPGGLIFVLIAVVAFCGLLWRASLASSIWSDEIFSIVESMKPAAAIWRDCAADRHPPGYHLFLKAWMWLVGHGHRTGPIAWERLPSLLAWLASFCIAFVFGERLLKSSRGLLLALGAGLGAQCTYSARETRSYGIAMATLFVGLLLLLALESMHRNRPRHRRTQLAAGWTAYGALAALALWMHFLSAIVLCGLGLLWLALAQRLPRERRAGFLIGGAAAQIFCLASILPWAAAIPGNLAHAVAPEPWMTPPTLANLALVPSLWYPVGRQGGTPLPDFPVAAQIALGAASFILPLAALAWTLWRNHHRRLNGRESAVALIAAAALGIATFNVFAIWALARWAGMATFHGPRYICLTAPFWGVGMAAAACLAAQRAQWRSAAAWILMLPWLFASIAGFAADSAAEKTAGLAPYIDNAKLFPPPHTMLFIMPSEMLPCYQGMLGDRWLRPVESLNESIAANGPAAARSQLPPVPPVVYLLNVNNWMEYAPERDAELLALMKGGKLADSVEPIFFPRRPPPFSTEYFTLFRLKGIHPETVISLFQRGFLSPPVAAPPDALAVVHPRDLLRRDGWYAMTFDNDGAAERWSARDETSISLPNALATGRYTLHLLGQEPAPAARLEWRIAGDAATEAAWKTAALTSGAFDLDLTFEIRDSLSRPALQLRHALLPANPDPATGKPRMFVGFQFRGLWLKRADQSSE